MKYQLQDLVNLEQIQKLFIRLYNITGISLAITDTEGKILLVTKMSEICENFHRKHPIVDAECVKSDQYLASHYDGSPDSVIYTCPRGLVESVIPIIIEGNHVANLFMGQLLSDKPDKEHFKKQAKEFGFDEKEYLNAVDKVQIISEEQINKNLEFIKSFVEILADLGLEKLKEINSQKLIKKAEKEISKREQYKLITENSTDMISLSDAKGKCIFTSPACQRIGGYKPSEIIGHTLKDFCHPDDRHIIEQAYNNLKPQTNSFTFDFRFLKKDKTYVWVETNGWAIFNQKTGKPLQIQYSTRDISERKQMEQEILKAKLEADRANAAKSEFLANMSHEIRTPLNAVIGFSELLSATIIDLKQKSYVESINVAGKSLLTLINDILDLSKIEAGMMEIKLAPVNPNDCFSEIEQIFRQKIKSKNLDFIMSIDQNLPSALLLDETRLRQVLLNLVGNAVKFTDKGKIELAVEKIFKDKNDGSRLNLKIHVKDTGVGIPENQQQTIFESFKQQSGLSSRKYEGTGLGLSITKKLVEMMNGKISVKSVVGVGSTFTVELFDVDVAVSSAKAQSMILENDFEFNKATLLVVDDVESNRQLIKELLTRKGLEVVSAENGFESLTIAKDIKPDAILMDIRMPVMDGYEACEKLKTNKATESIPVIALTASTFNNVNFDNDSHLFDGFLSKPVSTKELYDELKKYLPVTYKGKAPKTMEQKNISEQPEEISEELEKTISEKVLPMAKKLCIVFKLSQVGTFIELLNELGKKYYSNTLQSYAKKLDDDMKSFDVKKIKDTIKDICEKLEMLYKG